MLSKVTKYFKILISLKKGIYDFLAMAFLIWGEWCSLNQGESPKGIIFNTYGLPKKSLLPSSTPQCLRMP